MTPTLLIMRTCVMLRMVRQLGPGLGSGLGSGLGLRLGLRLGLSHHAHPSVDMEVEVELDGEAAAVVEEVLRSHAGAEGVHTDQLALE